MAMNSKKIIILGFALVLGGLLFYAGLDTATTNDKPSSHSQNKEKLPNDYMFTQRAYPTGQIKSGAYAVAAKWKKALSSQNKNADAVWEFTGPLNTGGRITDLEVSAIAGNPIFVGAASGGIFKSEDGGTTWTPIFDEQPMLSIGDIALAPSDQNILYVGTGEVNAGGGSLAYDGDGVYRSNDGGLTWQSKGLTEVGSIGKVLIDQNNPDIVYVGAMGPLFRNDTNRGVYKSTDGGDSWTQSLFISDKTGIIDMAIDPANADIVYAVAWERERTPENRSYGGPTSGIYKSTDGGATWNELTNGLPTAGNLKGRISIDIAVSNPDVLYASYADASGNIQGIYKTTDAGTTWATVSSAGLTNVGFHWWFGGLFINPENENEVYHVGFDMAKTTDGGASWQSTFTNVHVDQHALAFHPDDASVVFLGNDGGLYTSSNAGATSTKDLNLPITQFYRFYADPSNPDRLLGGTQDNNTILTTTAGLSDWNPIFGGDGFQPLVDKDDSNIVYALSQRGNLGKSINGGASFSSALSGVNPSDRNNWDTPIAFDPQDNSIVYYGTNRLYRSTDQAAIWTAISPDLTSGPSTGNLTFGTLTSIDVSPLDSAVIYVGTDDGNVWSSVDGGSSYTNISAGLPDRWVTRVQASPNAPDEVFVTFSGYRFGEDDGHVFMSTDQGASWTDLSGGIPDIPVNDIEIDGFDNLYIATDIGVLASSDMGASWQAFGQNMPSVVVTDLHIDTNTQTLYAATYGRSSYKTDISSNPLSVNDFSQSMVDMRLYPNPATTQFSISLAQNSGKLAIVSIYNQLGQLQQQFQMNTLEQTIPLDGYASGMYIVKLQMGSHTLSRKLLKK
jgi:photosystem II stability/assembly factor-like uncharacterized protein